MNNPDGSTVQTVLGDRSFSPGDSIEVRAPFSKPEDQSFKKVTVSIWSTLDCLIVKDEWGNSWCVFSADDIKKKESPMLKRFACASSFPSKVCAKETKGSVKGKFFFDPPLLCRRLPFWAGFTIAWEECSSSDSGY